ncbi:MFS transporter [Aquabacter spiritensis]|uniref:Putative MFS family arabinose efflux permease n=1 Tax=Aquabacter spiritensis TaxID=933073 RepID=A0A4R3M5G2_9HYPH|nr:MFS transporter [Aquabacter spiritensis]TCT06687.1 putative MFS family arabinose efflux permease [Aquabacter spiritensis]
MGPGLTLLLAFAGGVAVANLYYAQPLLGPISVDLGISPAAAGLAMTVVQVGYGLGMMLVVPLGDRFENRRLIVTALLVVALALIGAGLAQNAAMFLAAALVLGISASVAQVIVPFAAHLAPPEARGGVVGKVLSGLLLGMMLARPISSLVADVLGWRAIFLMSAGLVALVAAAIARQVPKRHPGAGFRYRTLLRSMRDLLRAHPVLRRRAGVQFFLFGAFTLFWTVIPLLLASPAYGMSQTGIAIFALIGVTGAAAAPWVGWAADRGWGRIGALAALAASAVAFLLCVPGGAGGPVALGALVVAGILLDCGVASSLVLSQRTVLALGSDSRSRLNGLFFTIFYSGGAVGSAVGAWAFVIGGWELACGIGLAMTIAAAGIHAADRRAASRGH